MQEALRLADELGFDPIDAGGLEESWRQQPGTPCYTKDLTAVQLKAALACSRAQPCAGIPEGGRPCGEGVLPAAAGSLMVSVALSNSEVVPSLYSTNITKYAGK